MTEKALKMAENDGFGNNLPMCRQPASGFTETPAEIIEWAKSTVSIAKEIMTGKQISAHVWAYREQDCQLLAVDLIDEEGHWYGINFTTGVGYCLHPQEPYVHDLTEALHMAGIVSASLGATVELGCRDNETNEAVLARPLLPGETNGNLALVIA